MVLALLAPFSGLQRVPFPLLSFRTLQLVWRASGREERFAAGHRKHFDVAAFDFFERGSLLTIIRLTTAFFSRRMML